MRFLPPNRKSTQLCWSIWQSSFHFSWFQLVQSVAQLLEVLNVWGEDDSEETTEWEEMAQIGGRILLGFISRQETEFCATASSKLSKLLKARTINSQVELCYVLGKLYNAFVDSRQKGNARLLLLLSSSSSSSSLFHAQVFLEVLHSLSSMSSHTLTAGIFTRW